MSSSLHTWYSLHDLEALGVRQAVLSDEIQLSQLSRLADLLHSTRGTVRASLRFGQRRGGWLGARLEYETSLELTCQRCLEPVRHSVAEKVELALVQSDSLAASVPEGREPVVLDDARLLPAQLIEDELIVSLPLVPRHARVGDCGSLARLLTDTEGPERAHDASDL